MKKMFLFMFIAIFVMCTDVSAFASYQAVPATGVTNQPMVSVGRLQMNTMAPANFKYPASYTNTTTPMVSNMIPCNNYNYPANVNGSNVNVYVGTPVYYMRSGVVHIKHRPRKGRVGTLYQDPYNYEYYDY